MNARMLFNLSYLFSNDKMPEVLAQIETVSFFVIAISKNFNGILHFVRNDKKDIVESWTEFSKK